VANNLDTNSRRVHGLAGPTSLGCGTVALNLAVPALVPRAGGFGRSAGQRTAEGALT
jgi:hypothetical protein